MGLAVHESPAEPRRERAQIRITGLDVLRNTVARLEQAKEATEESYVAGKEAGKSLDAEYFMLKRSVYRAVITELEAIIKEHAKHE